MKAAYRAYVAIAALTGLALAGAAQADPVRGRTAAPPATASSTPATDAFNVRGGETNSQLNPPGPRRTMRWDAARGRWSLQVDVDQPGGGREADWRDVQVGASYRLTRSLRVGAGVGVDQAPTVAPRATPDAAPTPRVRLETAFKF